MPDILIRNIPEKTLTKLKEKASLNKRSLQQELLLLLENSVQETYDSSAQMRKILELREEMAQYVISDSITDRIREERGEL
jgi:plasmid stability protein